MRKPTAALSTSHAPARKEPEPFLKTKLVFTQDAGLSSTDGTLLFAIYLPKSNLGGTVCCSALGFGLEQTFSSQAVSSWVCGSHAPPFGYQGGTWMPGVQMLCLCGFATRGSTKHHKELPCAACKRKRKTISIFWPGALAAVGHS